jgi:hypothetical protein
MSRIKPTSFVNDDPGYPFANGLHGAMIGEENGMGNFCHNLPSSALGGRTCKVCLILVDCLIIRDATGIAWGKTDEERHSHVS